MFSSAIATTSTANWYDWLHLERGDVSDRYLDSPTLSGQLKSFVGNQLKDFGLWLWCGFEAISFWAVTVYAIYNVCGFAVTRDNKYSKKIAMSILLYIFICIIGSVIR